jgi:hypothetical protein
MNAARRRSPGAWVLRARLASGFAGLGVGCSGGDEPAADTTGTTGASATLGTTDSTGAATSTITATAGSESSSGGSPSTTEADSGASTGEPGDTVVLQNDGYVPRRGLLWQTWPSAGDCWASSYVIDPGLYPFEIVGVQVAIGGASEVATFELGIWELDDGGLPGVEIDSAMVEIEGDVQGPDLDVADLLDLPTIANGSFAVVMCHSDHMGSPSIATDVDGTVDGAHNFVYQQIMGEWVSAPSFFGIDGDFVMRAVVHPL